MRALFEIEAMTTEDVGPISSIEGPTQMSEAELRQELARPWSRVWVARDPKPSGEVVAFVLVWHVADEVHVLNIATRADRRRRGIGRALLEAVIGYGRRTRIRHILLEVRRSNREAITLYRQVGFFAMGIRPRYYWDDEDAVEMLLTLDPRTGSVVRSPDEVRI